MTTNYERRLVRLEVGCGKSAGPCALLPRTIENTTEWLVLCKQEQQLKGHYEMAAEPQRGYVRNLIWVP